MAGGACRRRRVIDADDPLLGVQVHLVLLSPIGDAVLALVIDLGLRVIRAEVALAADLRLPGHRPGEGMATVARPASPARAVEVDSPYSGVGPGGRVEHRRADCAL